MKAVRDKFDLLITYTLPDTWNFNQITDEVYPKIRILLENRIHFYIIPKEWITAKSGLVEIIAEILNLRVVDILQIKDNKNQEIIVGCVCQILTSGNTLNDILTLIKQKLNLPSIQYFGEETNSISQIGIIIGYSPTPQLLKLIKRLKIDTLISTHFNFEIEKIAEDFDINLIGVSDYITNLGLLKLTQLLRMEHYDVEFAFENLKPSFKTF